MADWIRTGPVDPGDEPHPRHEGHRHGHLWPGVYECCSRTPDARHYAAQHGFWHPDLPDVPCAVVAAGGEHSPHRHLVDDADAWCIGAPPHGTARSKPDAILDELAEALRVPCPTHGIRDCSPLLNGCAWPTVVRTQMERVTAVLRRHQPSPTFEGHDR